MVLWYPHGARLQDPEEDAHAAQSANDVRPERPQRLSKLLLLAMFAYAASHLDPTENAAGDLQDPANEYSRRARVILDAIYHESRSATVQALILLGTREFGIGACLLAVCGTRRSLRLSVVLSLGSLEEGWLHIGTCISSAFHWIMRFT